jgi:hypothetical protein
MTLRAGYVLLAVSLQEAADALTSSDVRSRLDDAVREHMRSKGSYGYYHDHFGDDESGDVIYQSEGKLMKAAYTMAKDSKNAAKAAIQHDEAVPVASRISYDPICEEGDQYTAMEADKLYTECPFYERSISKAERDKADTSSFAGKGQSFPILKADDVMPAVRSLGRAGAGNFPSSKIKANIIRIANEKGFGKYLPKAWQGEAATESAPGTASLNLIEGATFCSEIPLLEADAVRQSYPIKIISPGTGSTAHYTANVLRKAAEAGVFKKGTFMFWNHQTRAEEAARPEGDLNNLAAITTAAGVYMENGAKGPGVYAQAKPFADYATKIESLAPHIGLSIRAGGTLTGRTVNGKPELASIDHCESVDYVTKAGRGGMALAEAARTNDFALEDFIFTEEKGVSEMDEKQFKALQESITGISDMVKQQATVIEGQNKTIAMLSNRNMRGDAVLLGRSVLATTGLSESQREFVVESICGTVEAPRELPLKEGVFDAAKFTESINAEAKRFASTLPNGSRVSGMGGAPSGGVQLTAEQIATREAAVKQNREEELDTFTFLMGDKKLAESAVRGRTN